MSVAAPAKIKKRITPTLISPIPITPKIAAEEEDKGPIGPRKNPRLLIKGGVKTKQVRNIIEGGRKLHPNSWIDHVKKFAASNDLAYGCALSNKEIKTGYVKGQFTNKNDVVSLEKKRARSTPTTDAKKGKKVKKDGEVIEAKKHEKFLKKLGIGDTQSVQKKRVGTFDALFNLYDKPMTAKEDAAFVKARLAQSEKDRKKSEKLFKKKQ